MSLESRLRTDGRPSWARTYTFLVAAAPQSREAGDRLEAKVDVLLRERGLDPDEISQRVNGRI